jgi:regulator of RNase E activity RraA
MPPDAGDPLAAASTAIISDCLNRFGAMSAGVRRLAGGALFGPAFTVRTMAGESSTLHLAVAAAPPGSILVVDAGGYCDRAVWGELLSVAAVARGLNGTVVDGAVRDVAAIRAMGYPLFARAHTPAGPHKGWTGDWGRPVSCGGVVVHTGDLVIGDDDGVVVVPVDEAPQVRAALEPRLEVEDGWRRRINAGESSAAVLGLERNGEVEGRR